MKWYFQRKKAMLTISCSALAVCLLRIFPFSNSAHNTGEQAGRETKIYMVSNVMHQQRDQAVQRHTKKQHCNWCCPNYTGVVRPPPRHSLERGSSIVLVIPPSRHEMSSEDLSPLIYVEKLDSISKLKTIKGKYQWRIYQ